MNILSDEDIEIVLCALNVAMVQAQGNEEMWERFNKTYEKIIRECC